MSPSITHCRDHGNGVYVSFDARHKRCPICGGATEPALLKRVIDALRVGRHYLKQSATYPITSDELCNVLGVIARELEKP